MVLLFCCGVAALMVLILTVRCGVEAFLSSFIVMFSGVSVSFKWCSSFCHE